MPYGFESLRAYFVSCYIVGVYGFLELITRFNSNLFYAEYMQYAVYMQFFSRFSFCLVISFGFHILTIHTLSGQGQ